MGRELGGYGGVLSCMTCAERIHYNRLSRIFDYGQPRYLALILAWRDELLPVWLGGLK